MTTFNNQDLQSKFDENGYIAINPLFSIDKIEEIKIGLEKSKGFIRRKLSQNLDLRRTPEIFFKVENLFY